MIMLRKLCFCPMLVLFCLILIFSYCSQKEEPVLKDAFISIFYIGTALNEAQIFGDDSKSIDLVKKQFNSITPENILKWEHVHSQPDQYDFSLADLLVAFGEKNGMFITGHTLVWHNQTPAWVFEDESGSPVNRKTLLRRMRDHIFTVVDRYKGRIHGWDVVNEAVEDNGDLRKSKWLEIIGEEYVSKAFEWAHEADPDAELYYNDYNMWHAGKRESVTSLIGDLLEKGVPIHGIGMQGHWGLDYPPLDQLEASINAYAGLGLKVMVTEMDINVLPLPGPNTGADISLNYELQKELNPYAEGLPDSMQEKLTARYVELFKILSKHSDKITRVTFWGVHDGVSWQNDWPVTGRTAYPMLFDRRLQPKPAFYEVIKTATDAY